MRRTSFVVVFSWLAASPVFAQDPVKTDPKHYTVLTENDQVRVLRVRYGAREKSVMHEHAGGVAVFVTDAHFKFTFSDGKTEERHGKTGDALWIAAERHLPENLSDQAAEVVLVELKAKGGATRPSGR